MDRLDAPAPIPRVRALCVHGLGLGAWLWEPWLGAFHEAGVSVVAPTLPGHGDDRRDVGVTDLVEAVHGELDRLPGDLPVALVGHSLGGLVAQLVLSRRSMHAGVLVCPLSPGQVFMAPDRRGLRFLPQVLPPVLAGRAYRPSWAAYRALGLGAVEEGVARSFYDRVTAWPNRLCRELVRRPHVDAGQVCTPLLVALGGRDAMSPWSRARVLGDLYEAVVWRYDDLGHSPTHEPGGLRMARDVAAFCVSPRRPQVVESEGYAPGEGVGTARRRERRGEAMKKRSAYGQKDAAR
ncbi:MAG: alpha/beta hydrolase [Deltaproteobacteria bacterium]|nr:alpha/beta hydrolase [Deltaproteobacteria bacterium]